MIKNCLWIFLLAVAVQTSRGFALLGPIAPSNGQDAWQSAVIGYDLATSDSISPGGPVYLGDIGGPRNYGEGYRRNVPIIYYTYDASFLNFFGSNGVAAVDSAVAIMNNLTNADQEDLSQFPLDPQRFNYTAQGTYLTDLKSTTLHLLVEQMGLAQPERFTWTLQDRFLPSGGKCPINEEYLVVQRNYADTNTSLSTVQYSAYVNNILYTYGIIEACTGPDPLAITVPYPVDPLADGYTAVADSSREIYGGLQVGGFYNALSQDDVAGIDYLLSTNRIAWERVPAGSLLLDVSTNFAAGTQVFPANTNSPSGFGTFNLASLLSYASTNSATNVMAAFPGVVISSETHYFILATNATVTSYYTNLIGSPYGSGPTLVVATNYTYYPLEIYVPTFANIVITNYSSNTVAILQTVTTGPGGVGSPYGSITTTTNYTKITYTNAPSGTYYIVPTVGPNECPIGILKTFQTNVIYTTNLITSAVTNSVTNSAVLYTYSQSLITSYTNYTYLTYTVNCSEATNATGLYEGIGRVQFVREDYDSLLGQYFQPVTNAYTMTAITNSHTLLQHFSRIVTAPEILLTGYPLVNGSPGVVWSGPGNGTVDRSITFDQSQLVAGGLAGPGVIDPPSSFQYNNIGSAFWNYDFSDTNSFIIPTFTNPSELNETNAVPSLAWASFDSTTNDPVLYPNGTSLANLGSEVLLQITPTVLPNGNNGVPYPTIQFAVTGSRLTAPFSWSATGLPPGLTLSSTGVLSGTPIDQTGGSNSTLVYDATITLTDSTGNAVSWNYPITIQ